MGGHLSSPSGASRLASLSHTKIYGVDQEVRQINTGKFNIPRREHVHNSFRLGILFSLTVISSLRVLVGYLLSVPYCCRTGAVPSMCWPTGQMSPSDFRLVLIIFATQFFP